MPRASRLSVVLTFFGEPRRTSFVVAGGAATLWCLFHPFLTQGILAGRGLVTIYQVTLERGAEFFGLDWTAFLMILFGLIAGHFLWGGFCGFVAWDMGRVVQRRVKTKYAETV